jgi:hypothetical protein
VTSSILIYLRAHSRVAATLWSGKRLAQRDPSPHFIINDVISSGFTNNVPKGSTTASVYELPRCEKAHFARYIARTPHYRSGDSLISALASGPAPTPDSPMPAHDLSNTHGGSTSWYRTHLYRRQLPDCESTTADPHGFFTL